MRKGGGSPLPYKNKRWELIMQKMFRTQKITAWVYTVVSVIVFIYTLCFMTEYKDLFGLKLKQNGQVSFFHDSILQTFNRQIFMLALAGIMIIVFSFFLEVFSKVPDLFAMVILAVCLAAACAGGVYAVSNIQAIEAFYRGLDFQYLYLEGMVDYEPHFTTFRVGIGIYIMQIAACAVYGIIIIMSHVTFVKLEKKGRIENEKSNG